MNDRSTSTADLQLARETFEANEPRDLFYRAATELVALALHQRTSLTVGEALAVLLRTWNTSYYRFQKRFTSSHILEIEQLVDMLRSDLMSARSRTIESLSETDRQLILATFEKFESVLGPVGAAKALHLLAPAFFPLWDRSIARHYVGELKSVGYNASKYYTFMVICQSQVMRLKSSDLETQEIVKVTTQRSNRAGRG